MLDGYEIHLYKNEIGLVNKAWIPSVHPYKKFLLEKYDGIKVFDFDGNLKEIYGSTVEHES